MAKTTPMMQIDGHDVRFTNPEKVMYPETGTTKAEVLNYYLRVAKVLIPQSSWRPATRKRWVEGVGSAAKPGPVFFRKDLEAGAPPWLPTGQMRHKSGVNTYPLVNDAAVLAWMTQLAALEIHTPQWRFNSLGAEMNPDRLVVDLDPGPDADLAECVEVAFLVRQFFDQNAMPVYPVTSGSKGIHLYVPLDGTVTSAQATQLAKDLASDLQGKYPNKVVAVQKKAERQGRVLLDWSQNSSAKTTVCPYSLRGRTQPYVAAPRTWEEIGDGQLRQLSYEEVLARVEAGLDPMDALGWHEDGPPGLINPKVSS